MLHLIRNNMFNISYGILKMIKPFINRYISMETFAGLLLICTMCIALIFANISSLQPIYDYIQHMYVGFVIGPLELKKSFLHWVNDGLMALFFFLISLEIKREVIDGELSNMDKAMLPILGAIGGMIFPIAIYLFFNISDPATRAGWAIPAATDIAFALGILSLLGNRVPISLKVFLTTLAVVDDLGAIIILALFYSSNLQMDYLLFAGIVILIMVILTWIHKTPISLITALGVVLWFLLLKSGVHATLAGVITALFIPFKCAVYENTYPLEDFEHALHGWVTFVILPIFAFVNAGVAIPISNIDISPLMLGIALGLIIGKQIGVFSICYWAIKVGLARLPKGVNVLQLYGVSVLCGVGFTMSLFIGGIPFENTLYMDSIRISVISASFISAIWGAAVLIFAHKQKIRQYKNIK